VKASRIDEAQKLVAILAENAVAEHRFKTAARLYLRLAKTHLPTAGTVQTLLLSIPVTASLTTFPMTISAVGYQC
jgi:hypothetical protein